MKATYICNQCGHLNYEQFSQTQVRCTHCGAVSEFDTGYKVMQEFEPVIIPSVTMPVVQAPEVAPLVKRFINYFIDVLVMVIITMQLKVIIPIEMVQIAQNDQEHTMLLILGLFPLYYTLMEFLFGKTLGKFFTRTKVISTRGERLTFSQCLFRALCRFIPFEYFSGLIFKSVFWHDSIPGTLVVED